MRRPLKWQTKIFAGKNIDKAENKYFLCEIFSGNRKCILSNPVSFVKKSYGQYDIFNISEQIYKQIVIQKTKLWGS